MLHRATRPFVSCLACFSVIALLAFPASAGTAFTFQGSLLDTSALPAQGLYDFDFTLFDDPTAGSQVGITQSLTAIDVVDGIFTVQIDFGAAVFDGTDLWIEIAAGETGQALTILPSRQAILPVPVAINADQLDGIDASTFLTAEVDGDVTNELQNVFATITADAGTTTANAQSDTLAVVGSGDVSTAVSADTLTIAATTDNLGNHTATQNIDLGTFKLVGNGGSEGLAIASDGVATVGGNIELDGTNATITATGGTISWDDDNLATTGSVTSGSLTLSGFDCNANANGGAITADASGVVSCSDDDDTQNTLDGAYDEGGAGVGRLITADSGAVRIEGSGGLEVNRGRLEQIPSNPVQVGSLSFGDDPLRIELAGTYAYVVDDGTNELHIIDVSNPTVPALVSTTAVAGRPSALAVVGQLALVGSLTEDGVRVYDVSAPEAPQSIGAVSLGEDPATIAVQGRYAYVGSFIANTQGTFHVIDLMDPTAPTVVGQLTVGAGTEKDVQVQGRYAYLVDSASDDLKVIDVTDPTSPVLAGSVSVLGGDVEAIDVSGGYAFVVERALDNLEIFDLTDPASPVRVGVLGIGSFPDDVIAFGRYVGVADSGSNDFKIIDVSNPSSPVLIGAVGGLSTAEALAVSGRYAYGLNGFGDRLVVFDLSGSAVAGLEAHSLEAGQLQSHGDLRVGSNVSTYGGINVGSGGVLSNGDVAISGSLAIAVDTAPTDSPANAVQLYAENVASSAELRVRDEAGNVTTLSPHNFSLMDGPSEPLAWSHYSRNQQGEVNVDMLRLVRAVEELGGETLVVREGAISVEPNADTLRSELGALERENAALSASNKLMLQRLSLLEARAQALLEAGDQP